MMLLSGNIKIGIVLSDKLDLNSSVQETANEVR